MVASLSSVTTRFAVAAITAATIAAAQVHAAQSGTIGLMLNIDRWRSDQFQSTHIWNPWSNKTDTNLEFCYSSQFSSLWGFSVTRFDYNGAKKSHDLL